MTRRGSDVHYQDPKQPALMLPVCGIEVYENTTTIPNDVTCLVCMAWLTDPTHEKEERR